MANPSNSNTGTGSRDLQSTNTKGKRKKSVPPNANPLFTKWISEWKNEAVEKGWKSQYNYAKALRTLKMFPLCLESGKDCKMLQNFGDKICKMLDEKLIEYKRDQDKGITNDSLQLTPEPSSSNPPVSNQPPSSFSASSRLSKHSISDNSDSGREEITSPQKKKKRKSSGTRSREYVPGYRSGPYALILTMYRYSLDPDYKGFMTKAELMHAAQPLADKSFTIPDSGSHYTAWSSMGTLIKRILIIKIGSPAKYQLTQEGADLGERLDNAEKGVDNIPTTTVHRNDCDNTNQNSSSISQSKASSKTTNLDHLDHLNLSAEEMAFLLEGMSQDANPTSGSESFPAPKVFDNDPVYVVSDDEEPTSFGSHQRNCIPSRVSKVHSLSPSLSPPSSPEIPTTKGLEYLPEDNRPKDNNDDELNECDFSVNDSVCVMNYDDDNDDEGLNISNGVQTSPARHRLPSLSPTPSFSYLESHDNSHSDSLNKLENDVIEIDDDDDNMQFKDTVSKKSTSGGYRFQFSQNSESCRSPKKKNIFRDVHYSSSQSDKNNSQSDDDDLPDIDFCVPLSKRLLSKGTVSSQLLSHFNSDLKELHSSGVCTNIATVSKTLPSKQHSSHWDEIVILEDDVPESIRPFTSVTTKPTTVENTPQLNTDRELAKSTFPTAAQSVCNSEGADPSLETCPTPEFTLHPGSYEIVLCIDNREFYGSKSNSKTLLPDLIQTGVNCDLRLLHIGDILWVAREKGNPNEGIPRADRKELVLNFAIERKRMDDLVSSMTGGRLKEQKFRLKHCGLSELIILIEEYGSIQNFSISEDRIKQGIVNSQILDGFKVKRCGSSKEAVMYLSMMTRFMQKYYGNKTLHAASHEFVKSRAPKSTVRDNEYYLMPFELFNETSIKHKALTVKEMFGKQLIQIPGVSLERACAITKVFPSLASLLKAYQDCTSEKSKEGLLATIKCGNKERNLGIAISRMMHMIYNTAKLS